MAVLLFVSPLAEEILFRLGMHQALLVRGFGQGRANLLVALLFAALHVLLRGQAEAALVALPALIIGRVFERQQRLAPCVLLHALMNLIWLGLS